LERESLTRYVWVDVVKLNRRPIRKIPGVHAVDVAAVKRFKHGYPSATWQHEGLVVHVGGEWARGPTAASREIVAHREANPESDEHVLVHVAWHGDPVRPAGQARDVGVEAVGCRGVGLGREVWHDGLC